MEVLDHEIDVQETVTPVVIGSIALSRRETRLLNSRRLRKQPNQARHGGRVHNKLYRLLCDYYTVVHQDIKERQGAYYSNASSAIYAGNAAVQGSNFDRIPNNASSCYAATFTPGENVGTIMRYDNPNPQGAENTPWQPDIGLPPEGAAIILRTQILA